MPNKSAKLLPSAFSTEGSWTREQTKLALYFYCQTPFGQLHARNKKLIALANLIGRSPSALARKCTNLASLDPAIVASGRVGSANRSHLDEEIWDEFHADWERLVLECNELKARLLRERKAKSEPPDEMPESLALANFTGETRQAIVQQRIKQDFFRRAVLSSYHGRCCISGVNDPCLLVASHIVPWSVDKANRLNPSNGLCLSAIHDKAFDNHLFSLTDDACILLSTKLKVSKNRFLCEVFWPVDGKPIEAAERFTPNMALIAKHRRAMLEMYPVKRR